MRYHPPIYARSHTEQVGTNSANIKKEGETTASSAQTRTSILHVTVQGIWNFRIDMLLGFQSVFASHFPLRTFPAALCSAMEWQIAHQGSCTRPMAMMAINPMHPVSPQLPGLSVNG
jgi:hypothetical protein